MVRSPTATRLLRPEIMAPPLLWLVSDARPRR